MQEVMNKIVDAEQKAQDIRNAAQNQTKTAQLEAARQGKESIDKARREAGECAKDMLSKADTQAREILTQAEKAAVHKAANLIAGGKDRTLSAARFVMERIVDSV